MLYTRTRKGFRHFLIPFLLKFLSILLLLFLENIHPPQNLDLFLLYIIYLRILPKEESIMTPMNNADYLTRLEHADELEALKAAKKASL